MNTALVISLGLPEIIIFQLGAVILGFCLHLFLVARKNAATQIQQATPAYKMDQKDEWVLKYFDEIEKYQKKLDDLEAALQDAKDTEENLNYELEAALKQNELLTLQVSKLPKSTEDAQDYLGQLQNAQQNLQQHNQQIQNLLENIKQLKETDKKYQAALQENEALQAQVNELKIVITAKDNELKQQKQEQSLYQEINAGLSNAYSNYNQLQEKIEKLESALTETKLQDKDYDSMQSGYFKLNKEYEDLKQRQSVLLEENQRMIRIVTDTEDKLREANFQRQQLLKKVNFLEELNRDLQDLTGHYNKLQSQLRRMSELESMLAKVKKPEEREPTREG